jgi:hypothetical protein
MMRAHDEYNAKIDEEEQAFQARIRSIAQSHHERLTSRLKEAMDARDSFNRSSLNFEVQHKLDFNRRRAEAGSQLASFVTHGVTEAQERINAAVKSTRAIAEALRETAHSAETSSLVTGAFVVSRPFVEMALHTIAPAERERMYNDLQRELAAEVECRRNDVREIAQESRDISTRYAEKAAMLEAEARKVKFGETLSRFENVSLPDAALDRNSSQNHQAVIAKFSELEAIAAKLRQEAQQVTVIMSVSDASRNTLGTEQAQYQM